MDETEDRTPTKPEMAPLNISEGFTSGAVLGRGPQVPGPDRKDR